MYCLPDDYEVIHPSLADIQRYLNPTFTKDQLPALDTNTKIIRAQDGSGYLPGIVGQ